MLTPALAITSSGISRSLTEVSQATSASCSRTSSSCVTTRAPSAVHASSNSRKRVDFRPCRIKVFVPAAAYSSASAPPMPPVAPVMSTQRGKPGCMLLVLFMVLPYFSGHAATGCAVNQEPLLNPERANTRARIYPSSPATPGYPSRSKAKRDCDGRSPRFRFA